MFNEGNSGMLTVQQMEKSLTKLGLAPNTIPVLTQAFDVDEDAEISIDEFCSTIHTMASGDARDVLTCQYRSYGATKNTERMAVSDIIKGIQSDIETCVQRAEGRRGGRGGMRRETERVCVYVCVCTLPQTRVIMLEPLI